MRATFRAALAMAAFLVATAAGTPFSVAAEMTFCSGRDRVTCVVDGDTVWIDGEKIRLAGIDAPEIGGRCHAEMIRAANAAERLRQLLSAAFIIEREGKDRFGRTLARLRIGDTTAGEIMIAEDLARPWRGRREKWCG